MDYITKVYKNVPVLTKDALEASDLFFKQGQGDVLINYENEVILAERDGQKLPYAIPGVNISIDNPVAVVDKNVDKHNTRVDFLYSPEAQQEFALLGYRPVNPNVVEEVAKNYPQVQTLFTVLDLGGWDAVQKKFFEEGATFDKIQSQAANRQISDRLRRAEGELTPIAAVTRLQVAGSPTTVAVTRPNPVSSCAPSHSFLHSLSLDRSVRLQPLPSARHQFLIYVLSVTRKQFET